MKKGSVSPPPPPVYPEREEPKVNQASGVPARSEGHRLLMCVQASGAAIGEACKVSKQVVGCWRRGDKAPAGPARAQLERAYGIPAASWGQEPEGARPPPPSRSSVPPAGLEVLAKESPTTMEGVDALLVVIRAQRARPGLLARELVTLADSEVRLLALRHRLEKEAELLEDRIVKQHPLWARIEAQIARTLVRFPEAARAVAAALKELGE